MMLKNPVAWGTLGVLIALTAATLWLDSIVQPPEAKLDGSARHDPDFIVEKFSSVKLYPSGDTEFTLAAIKMTHYPDTQTSYLERPHFARFAPNNSSAPLHAYAQRGVVTEDGEQTDLYDNVRVIREAQGIRSELTLATTFLKLFPNQGFAVTDKPVVIDDAHTHITAVGLKLDSNKRELKLLSRVKVRYDKPRRP